MWLKSNSTWVDGNMRLLDSGSPYITHEIVITFMQKKKSKGKKYQQIRKKNSMIEKEYDVIK